MLQEGRPQRLTSGGRRTLAKTRTQTDHVRNPDPVRLRHTSRSERASTLVRRHQLFRPPCCPQCGTYLETAATKNNPAAEIRPLNMARCGACMVLHVLEEDSQPRERLTCDETSFNAAMKANPEIYQWSQATLRRRRSLCALEMQGEMRGGRRMAAASGRAQLRPLPANGRGLRRQFRRKRLHERPAPGAPRRLAPGRDDPQGYASPPWNG